MGGETQKNKTKRHAGFLIGDCKGFCTMLIKKWHTTVRDWDYVAYRTKQRVLVKFLIILAIISVYLTYVLLHFGSTQGLIVAVLTWTFFVLCTPIADAGVLFDFPLHFLGIKMVKTEIVIWLLSLGLNIYVLMNNAAIYNTTIFLKLLKYIMTNPNPYWLILLLSAIGTLLSTVFADELIVVASERKRKIHQKNARIWLMVLSAGIVLLAVVLYQVLLQQLNVRIPLF